MSALVMRHSRETGVSECFALRLADEAGMVQAVNVVRAAGLPLELAAAARAMPPYRGQRSNQGLWWLATTGRHVGYESWLERDHLTLLAG
ncbi:hypothetical protein [Dactylosporangium sp. NPDC051541]|uniref:hypothetical protein n=1 Tax=Dactylosporangium sp. NPDC051541 TaxID=3363977 RepID=UPI0037A5AC7E